MDKDLLDDLHNILEGNDGEESLNEAIKNHWDEASPIFGFCGPVYDFACGCLTQVKGRICNIHEPEKHRELQDEIVNSDKLATSEKLILPEEMRDLTFPLSQEDREKAYYILLPYAEFQMKVRETYDKV